jgi:hypothetical protein
MARTSPFEVSDSTAALQRCLVRPVSRSTIFIFDADGRHRYRGAGVVKRGRPADGLAASLGLSGSRAGTISNMSARLELRPTKRRAVDLCRTAGCRCCSR